MFDYENAGKNAQPEVKKAIERFLSLSEEERAKRPLLYWLLGSGTTPYKVAKKDCEYTDLAKTEKHCANCEFMYKKTANGKYICSQISGRIQPEGWCNRWTPIRKRD